MGDDSKFVGWVGENSESVTGKMEWKQYKTKNWEENDIEIEISHCGICGSDLHTLRSGWAPTNYPCVVGHEIVGKAVRVGSKAEKGIKVGDRVGVGAQSDSCLQPECEECSHHSEQHCYRKHVDTYDTPWPDDGTPSKGGYGDYWRGPSHFVFKIPDKLPSSEAAPMLCGGVTVYSPLVRNGCGPGKTIGVVGVGGLGHFAVLFAKALGADKVIAISRSGAKKVDAQKLGADEFIATNDDKDWATHHSRSVDLLISTVSSPHMPLQEYLQLLKTNGQFIQVGAPEDSLPSFNAFALILKNAKVGGSAIGSPKEIEEMLQLAVEKGVKPWIKEYPLKEANQAIVDFEKGLPRFRFVLVNEKHAGK